MRNFTILEKEEALRGFPLYLKRHILTDDEILHDPVISDYLSKFLNRVNGENKEDIQKRIHYEFNVLMYPCITESTTDIYQTTNPEIPIILELDVCFRKYLTDYSFM